MAGIIVTGGFGSKPNRMNYLAAEIGGSTAESARGWDLASALGNLDEYAEDINGSRLYLHSGAILAAHRAITECGAKPESVTAVAPAVHERFHRLLVRGALMGLGFRHEPWDDPEQTFNDPNDLLRHPIENFIKRMPTLSRFDAFQAGIDIREQGVPVTLAFMEKDGLFDLTKDSIDHSVQRARSFGVRVLTVEGSHCSFTHQPLKVLTEIEQSGNVPFYIPDRRGWSVFAVPAAA